MMSVRHLIAAAAPRQPSRIHKDPEHGVPILGVAKYVKFAMSSGSAPEWPFDGWPNAVVQMNCCNHVAGFLTPRGYAVHYGPASTSLGEASARIQATDLERRKTPRVRTAPPGLRVEPKWLPARPDTPCGAKAPTRGVPPDRSVGHPTSLGGTASGLIEGRWVPG